MAFHLNKPSFSLDSRAERKAFACHFIIIDDFPADVRGFFFPLLPTCLSGPSRSFETIQAVPGGTQVGN